jgi:hypothetical protein
MIDHELHSSFSYLTTLEADLCEEPYECGSEHVRLGVFENGEPPTIPGERFFAMLRFEQRGRLEELPLDLEEGGLGRSLLYPQGLSR